MPRILIVDDDDAFRESLAETLASLGHSVAETASGEDALRAMNGTRFATVFLDLRMPGMGGLEALAQMAARPVPLPPVVVLTAHASGSNTIEAMRLGAFDHLTKPIGRDAIRAVLGRTLAVEAPATPAWPAPFDDSPDDSADALIGVGDAMREVHKRIGIAAASDAPVLVLGETGTGKEMVARALHRHSSRAGAPFIAINCAAIPKELLESELFGHVRGAFTGAVGDRPGCFRAADRGVLLLDEIGDMPIDVQGKMLRALQEHEVTPVGSHRSVKVDVRVIAATHRDLRAAVSDGSFREDLLYRLDVLSIRVPPLRDRLADIIPLAEHFLRLADRTGSTGLAVHPKRLSSSAAQALIQRPWPGNVRELQNLMARCQAMVRHPVISAADLASDDAAATDAPIAGDIGSLPVGASLNLPEATERLERSLIAQALQRSDGNRAEAARRLGIHRQLLYRKLEQYGLGTGHAGARSPAQPSSE